MTTTNQIKDFEEIEMSALIPANPEDNAGRADPEKDDEVNELSKNIKSQGLIQPIIIAERKDSTPEKKLYDVVAGNRRFAAWKIAFPETETIKCLVLPKDTSQIKKSMLSLSENIMRLAYNPRDKGILMKKLLPVYNNDPLELAKALGYETATQVNEWIDMLDISTDLVKKLQGPEPLKIKRAKLVSTLPEDKQSATIEALNKKDKGDYDTRKFVSYIKQNKSLTPQQVMEMIDNESESVSMMIKVTEPVNAAIIAAAKSYKERKIDLAVRAIKDFLRREGYLDDKDLFIMKQDENEEKV